MGIAGRTPVVIWAALATIAPGFASNPAHATHPVAPGDLLWVARYDGAVSGYDDARAMAVSPDGSRVYVTGASAGPLGGDDYATVAYDASTGSLLWEARYDDPGNSSGTGGASIAVSPDGSRVFVTGGAAVGGDYIYATIAYDAATGTGLWLRTYGLPGGTFSGASALGLSPDGSTVFVTGWSDAAGGSSGIDFVTLAYRADTGDALWMGVYTGPKAFGQDVPRALGVSPDGSKVFVTGESLGQAGDSDYATVAYDAATGETLWHRRYDGLSGQTDEARSLALSPEGSTVFVTGQADGIGFNTDYTTIAYDAVTGTPRWLRRYRRPGGGVGEARSVVASPDGSKVFVTGQASSGRDYDFATQAMGPSTGRKLWSALFDGPRLSDNSAYAAAVSPDGTTLFVTGYGGVTGHIHFLTVAFDTRTGSPLWFRRYVGPARGEDIPAAITVSPDGTAVFVTGKSDGVGGEPDYATVAYAA